MLLIVYMTMLRASRTYGSISVLSSLGTHTLPDLHCLVRVTGAVIIIDNFSSKCFPS